MNGPCAAFSFGVLFVCLAGDFFTQIEWDLIGVVGGGLALLLSLLLLSPPDNLILDVVIVGTSPHDYRMEQLAGDLLVFSHVLGLFV